MKTKAQVIEWLSSTNPVRVILVEISGVSDSSGNQLPTFYLSNCAYGTGALPSNYKATSTSSITNSLGTKTFQVQANKIFNSGDKILVTNISDTTKLLGNVVSYTDTTLIVNITSIIGTVSTAFFNNWNIESAVVPENVLYDAGIVGGVTFNESIDFNGTPTIGYGDIELENVFGNRDEWLQYVWANKAVSVLIGDASWSRIDFYPIFKGLIKDIDIKSRNSLNLILVNNLQSINEAISSDTLIGTSTTQDQLIPLCFGECFNVTPAVKVASALTYQVHNGPIEGVIEVRENGAPIPFSQDVIAGTFQLQYTPFGPITATVQGAKPNAVYVNKIGSVIKTILRNYGKQLSAEEVDEAGMALVDDDSGLEVGVYLTNRENVLDVCQRIAYSGGYYLVPDISGKLKLIRLVVDDINTYPKPGLISASSEFDNVAWLTSGVSVSQNYVSSIIAPDNYTTAYKITETSITGTHRLYTSVTTEINHAYSFVAYYKNQNVRYVRHSFVSQDLANGIYVDIDLELGIIVNSGQLGTGALFSFGITNLGDGWYKVVVTGICSDASTSNYCAITLRNSSTNVLTEEALQYTGNISNSMYVWAAQLLPIHLLTQTDIELNSFSITQKLEVESTVKLGYSKNWTPQSSGLVSALSPEVVTVLEKPYYYETEVDSFVLNQYGQFGEPVAKETLLISEIDAANETARLLNIKKVPRFVYTGNYLAKMLFCELGDLAHLIYPRFGLNNGKTGIVVSVSRDWLHGKAVIGVLI
jgi:hypothetical protein